MLSPVGRQRHWRSSQLVVLVVGGFALLAALVLASSAHAYTFGPGITGLGAEQTAFDYTSDHCAADAWDIPDEPARAFKDDRGRVHLHFTAFPVRRNIGSDLNVASSVGHHDCTVVIDSAANQDPSKYDQYNWVSAPYTPDGRNVYALVHHEYRAWVVSSPWTTCSPPNGDTTKCWYNAITLATSTNSGDLFTHTAAPSHLVASQPDRWVNGTGPLGIFSPSNIIKKVPDDGYYYDIVRAKESGKPDISCLMRTKTLNDPALVAGLGWKRVQDDVRQPVHIHPNRGRPPDEPRLQGHRRRCHDGRLREPDLQHVLPEVPARGRLRRLDARLLLVALRRPAPVDAAEGADLEGDRALLAVRRSRAGPRSLAARPRQHLA